jgi:hypothetical protein
MSAVMAGLQAGRQSYQMAQEEGRIGQRRRAIYEGLMSRPGGPTLEDLTAAYRQALVEGDTDAARQLATIISSRGYVSQGEPEVSVSERRGLLTTPGMSFVPDTAPPPQGLLRVQPDVVGGVRGSWYHDPTAEAREAAEWFARQLALARATAGIPSRPPSSTVVAQQEYEARRQALMNRIAQLDRQIDDIRANVSQQREFLSPTARRRPGTLLTRSDSTVMQRINTGLRRGIEKERERNALVAELNTLPLPSAAVPNAPTPTRSIVDRARDRARELHTQGKSREEILRIMQAEGFNIQ